MPKELTAATAVGNTIASKLGGLPKTAYKSRSGKEVRSETGSFNLLAYGEMGTGKTKIAIDLLLLGLKVYLIDTDFGRKAFETIRNYFHDHPDKMQLFDDNFRCIELDVDGVMSFCRNPASVEPDIYEWDPDVIFWDGLSAYQQGDLEAKLCNDEFTRDDNDFSLWRGSRNGTLFPLMKLLNQHNTKSGKQWNKVVTLMEDERVDKRKSASKAEKKSGEDVIAGSEHKGPMLNTTARDLAGAGFSIVLRCIKKQIGKDVQFKYQTLGEKIISKDRYGLPPEVEGDFQKVYRQYIEPKIKGATE